VLTVTVTMTVAPAGSAYAVNRPHARDDLVPHAYAVGAAQPLPTTDLTVGAPPLIPFASASTASFLGGDWVLHRPDGTSLALPELTWTTWAPVGDGAIGMAYTEAGPELQEVSATGEVRSRLVQHFGLAVSPDEEIVGWLGDRGHPHVVEGGGARRFTMPRVPRGTSIAAIWGLGTCQEAAPEGGGCTVFVDAPRHAWVSTSHGIVDVADQLLAVSDVAAGGRVAALVSRATAYRGACWGVVRPDGHRVFRTCTSYLDAFSPDGRNVLAEQADAWDQSVGRFSVLGRDGRVVRSWTFDAGPHRSLSQLTWEDEGHLLGVLRDHGVWGVVRIGLDGLVTYAGEPVASEFVPFSLPLR
jgi:hypothetical protein